MKRSKLFSFSGHRIWCAPEDVLYETKKLLNEKSFIGEILYIIEKEIGEEK